LAASYCANTAAQPACRPVNIALSNDETRTSGQPLGDLTDDDPDFAQKRLCGARQRPLARANDGGGDLARRLEGADGQIVVAAEQRRERIDHRDADTAFGEHAGGVAVADLDRKAERLAGLRKGLPHD